MAPSAAQEEEDDYMTMLLPDDDAPKHESSIRRRARQQREAEQRAHPKSKTQLDREAREARDTALSSSILAANPDNKGARILAKLGYTSGPLGAGGDANARTEPINLVMKEDKSGIGHESEAKRKFREEAEALNIDTKKRKINEDEYQQRVSQERKEKRIEGQLWGAMKVAERLDEEVGQAEKLDGREQTEQRPAKSIPLVWRQLVKDRIEREREQRRQRSLHESLPQSRLPKLEDSDEDEDDKIALAREDKSDIFEAETEEEDPEFEEFIALDPESRLQNLIEYLRKKYQYCFWCKYQYPDEAMEGCPGLTEDEHD
ncbi:MAG: hypothetical protein M1821_008650 [Bathelium mastoideum]|nr:MAG: hypothetical protein M1821_008650 [Bathelium mastoideum]